jgi:hypothetical protein
MDLRFLFVANASDHQFEISSKADRKQNGDIWETHGHFAPCREQFTPANQHFDPQSFHFGPFRVKNHPSWREPWLITGLNLKVDWKFEKATDVVAICREAGFVHNRSRRCVPGRSLSAFRDRRHLPVQLALEPPFITPEPYATGCHLWMEMPEEG